MLVFVFYNTTNYEENDNKAEEKEYIEMVLKGIKEPKNIVVNLGFNDLHSRFSVRKVFNHFKAFLKTFELLNTKYKNEIMSGTFLLQKYPKGVIISAVAVITNGREVTFVKECYTNECKCDTSSSAYMPVEHCVLQFKPPFIPLISCQSRDRRLFFFI